MYSLYVLTRGPKWSHQYSCAADLYYTQLRRGCRARSLLLPSISWPAFLFIIFLRPCFVMLIFASGSDRTRESRAAEGLGMQQLDIRGAFEGLFFGAFVVFLLLFFMKNTATTSPTRIFTSSLLARSYRQTLWDLLLPGFLSEKSF